MTARLVRQARLRAGLTQQELALRAGMTQPALARIESARVVPRFDTVTRLLAECGMRLEALPIAGRGIDRSTIRRMRELTPRQRLETAAREASAMNALTRR